MTGVKFCASASVKHISVGPADYIKKGYRIQFGSHPLDSMGFY